MFREMRRKGQSLPKEEIVRILEDSSHGILALTGDDGYPYAVPLSFVYHDDRLIFHSALAGHKIDSIRASAKASFCIVDRDDVVPMEYTTRYRSVIAFGRVSIVSDDDKRRSYIEELSMKYAPFDTQEHRNQEISKEWDGLCVLEFMIDHITGKESRVLAAERRKQQRN